MDKTEKLVSLISNLFNNVYNIAKDEKATQTLKRALYDHKHKVNKLIRDELAIRETEHSAQIRSLQEKLFNTEGQMDSYKDLSKKLQLMVSGFRLELDEKLTEAESWKHTYEQTKRFHDKAMIDLKKQNDELQAQLTALEVGKCRTSESSPDFGFIECAICNDEYSTAHYPMIASCGHSMCQPCQSKMQNFSCPFCKADASFRRPAKNYLAFELIEKFRDEKK